MAAGSHRHATVRAVGSLPSTVSAIISSSEPALSWAPSAAFSHNRALWGSGNNVLSLRDKPYFFLLLYGGPGLTFQPFGQGSPTAQTLCT